MHRLLHVYSSRADIPRAEALKEERLVLNEYDDYIPSKDKLTSEHLKKKPRSDDLPTSLAMRHKINEVCVTQVHYYSLLVTLILMLIWLMFAISYFVYNTRRRHKKISSMQNLVQSRANNFKANNQLNQQERTAVDPKTNKSIRKLDNAIYSDITMNERPRSVTETQQYGSVLMNIY